MGYAATYNCLLPSSCPLTAKHQREIYNYQKVAAVLADNGFRCVNCIKLARESHTRFRPGGQVLEAEFSCNATAGYSVLHRTGERR